jgi:serine phosphatase RsbU (regulator of sigma subunit)
MSPDNEEYTDERFIELIESYPDANSNQLTNIIVQDVMEHQGGGEQSDDITIVTFKLL